MAEEFDPDELLNSHYDEMQPSDYGLPADYNAQAAVKQAETTGLGSVVPTSMEDTDVMGAGKFVAEMTPIIGDAMAAKEVYDELQKDEPNYYLAGVLGGATIIGLIPGVGDAAANAIRAGAKSAGKLGGEVVGNTKALLQGDMDFIRGRGMPSESQGVGAEVVKQTDEAFGGASTATKLDNLFENMGEEGALAEFSSIGENINSYIMNVDNKALLNALSDPNMEAYRDVLQANLSEAFPTGKIKVTRIEGYADPSAKKTKKDFVVDAKDVFFVGNVDEKELIVRSRATGKPMSVRIQDDQSFSKVDKPKKEPVLEPVSTAASAYFPQKTTTAAVKQSVWEQAGIEPPKGFENLTGDQLEKYKEIIANPYGDDSVSEYVASLSTDPNFDIENDDVFFALDELAYDKGIVNKPTEYTFRSPIPDIANTVTIPQDGIRGADFLKELDRNPDVRNSEVAALDLEIEPTKRYTREELVAITNAHTYDTKAIINRGTKAKYEANQRQVGSTGLLDDTIQEVEYAEIIINATRDENVKAGFKLDAGSHFGQQNMAHSRVSIIEDATTKDRSVLVEEVQTDMIQHGYIKPSPPVSKSQFLQDRKKEALRNIEELLIVDYAMRPNKPLNVDTRGFKPRQKEMFSDLLDYIAEVADTPRKGISPKEYSEKMKELSATYLEAFNVPTANTGVILGAPSDAAWATYPEPDLNGIAERLIKKPRTEWDADDRSIYRRLVMDIDVRISPVHSFVKDYAVVGKGIGAPPIKKIDEATRLSLLSAMSYAADNGVSKITIPNIERIVQKRFTPGSKQYNEAIKPGSGFHNTYVKSVDKFIKELQSNFGGNSISVSKIELPYKKGQRSGLNMVNPTTGTKLSNEATVIDFSALIEQGYDLTKPRFAKGGVVTNTEKQMNNLFAEGGIKDDGMNVDPVSGNEVPSGSMASEVRDDIDAKLSEGEYVVPADVVRYFGVAFFEKLRAKAKEGLSGMESDGRIGGEPVEDDALPFDVSELQSIDEGGTDAQMQDLGMAEGGIVGYAPGGDVVPMPTIGNGYSAGFSPRNFPIGFSVFGNRGAASTEPVATSTKTYTNAAGDTITIRFDANGNPMDAIPEGYFLVGSQGAIDALQTSPTDTFDRSNDDPATDPFANRSREFGLDRYETTSGEQAFQDIVTTSKYNADGSEKTALQMQREMGEANVGVLASYDDPKTWMDAVEGAIKNMNEARTTGKVASTIGGAVLGPVGAVLGGAVGIVGQATEIAKMRALVKAGEDWGSLNAAQAAEAYKAIDAAIATASPAVQKLVAEGTGISTGTKFYMETMRQIEAQHAMGVTTDLSNSRYELWDTLTSVNSNTDEAMAAREKVNNEEKARIEEEERKKAAEISQKYLDEKAIRDKAIADKVANDASLAEQKRIQMERETAARQQAERDAFTKEQAARDKAEAQAELDARSKAQEEARQKAASDAAEASRQAAARQAADEARAKAQREAASAQAAAAAAAQAAANNNNNNNDNDSGGGSYAGQGSGASGPAGGSGNSSSGGGGGGGSDSGQANNSGGSTKVKKETISQKISRGGGFSKGGLMSKNKK
jgi:hypothetical protein